MKILFQMFLNFLLVAMLTTMPTTTVSACGGSCSNNEKKETKSDCCKKHSDKNDKDNCGGDCGGKCPAPSCHCTPISVAAIPAEYPILTTICPLLFEGKINPNYAGWFVKDITLDVWKPPKI